MAPRKHANHASGSHQNDTESEDATTTQFQALMQAMLDQQRQANENQARFQEQMAKKDEEMANVQRKLLEVLQNRPQDPQAHPIVVNHRNDDPNIMFERFKKREPR